MLYREIRPPEMAMPAVTIRLTDELRPGRGDGRRGAGSEFGRQRPSTQTGWERLAAVRLRSAATAAPAVADAPSAPLAQHPSGQVAASARSSDVTPFRELPHDLN